MLPRMLTPLLAFTASLVFLIGSIVVVFAVDSIGPFGVANDHVIHYVDSGQFAIYIFWPFVLVVVAALDSFAIIRTRQAITLWGLWLCLIVIYTLSTGAYQNALADRPLFGLFQGSPKVSVALSFLVLDSLYFIAKGCYVLMKQRG